MSRRLTMAFLMLLTLMGYSAMAGQYNEKVNIGDEAPVFSALPGIDGKEHSLKDYADAKAVVVVFTCNHCPVAKAYEDRLMELQEEYKDKDVQVVAISANSDDGDKLEKMKEHGERFNFPYLRDDAQKSSEEFGAAVTPHVFLLDGERKIAYMGSVDDNQDTSKVSKHYLRDAIDAVLVNKKPETTETRQFGCGIR